jgi:hypothetical protein
LTFADTGITLTLDKIYQRVRPKEITYTLKVPRNRKNCTEHRVFIEVSARSLAVFPLPSHLNFNMTDGKLIPWHRIFIERQVIGKSPPCMKPESTSPSSLKTIMGHNMNYSIPVQF